jgi:ATP-dependent RNA helicase DeaD
MSLFIFRDEYKNNDRNLFIDRLVKDRTMKFSELDLMPEMQKALGGMGYEDMTPIQEMTLPHIMQRKDVLAQAETGSGKTAACAIPMVQMVDPTLNEIQALVLVPTRELALQYVSEIAKIAKHSDVVPFAIYGGFPMEIQKAKLNDKVHILVATPGRLIDFLYNTPMTLSHVRTMVLDEADEMMNMGFIDDVNFIMSCVVNEHQTLLFSATMPQRIVDLVKQYLKEPVHVRLNQDQVAPQSLVHTFQYIDSRKRLDALRNYLGNNDISQAIIFSNSRHGGEKLRDQLRGELKSMEFIHGGLDQSVRTSIFRRFRNKDIKFMVATDIAGRGLDFSHVSHVINYDFPIHRENYTHRTGRAGRMGREGVAMSFVTDRDLRLLSTVISTSKVDPVWEGDAPDMGNSKRGGGESRGGGRGRSQADSRRRPQRRGPRSENPVTA